jgi:hypothetical protein
MDNEIDNKRNIYMKKYMNKCEHLKCICGGIFKSYSKHIHNKSKRHLNFINSKDVNVDILYKKIIIEG